MTIIPQVTYKIYTFLQVRIVTDQILSTRDNDDEMSNSYGSFII